MHWLDKCQTPIRTRAVFALLSALLLPTTLRGAESGKIGFNFQIRPLLSDRCFRCHGPDAGARKSKMRLDTLDGSRKELEDGWAVIKPGEVDKSEIGRASCRERVCSTV